MIEIAGFILSGASFVKDLYKEYKDYSTWPLADLMVEHKWLPLAIEKNFLEGPLEDYRWVHEERIPTFELQETHKVVIVFNEDRKEAYRIVDANPRPSILIKKIT